MLSILTVTALALTVGLVEGRAATLERQASTQVELVTIGPGDPLLARFGHTAIRVRHDGRDLLFNFGTYQPDSSAWTYLRGELDVWLNYQPLLIGLRPYREAGRAQQIQELDLPPAVASRLLWMLMDNARLERRFYAYDAMRDNCSTRARDLLDRALNGALREELRQRPGATPRERMLAQLRASPYVALLLDLVMNGNTDVEIVQWDALFLPAALQEALRTVRVWHPDGSLRPLVRREYALQRSTRERQPARPWLVWFLACGAMLALVVGVATGSRRWGGLGLMLWGAIAALAGAVLAVGWVTAVPDFWANANLAGYTPFHAGLLLVGWRRWQGRSGPWARRLALALSAACTIALLAWLIALGLGWVVQANLRFSVFALAMNGLAGAVVLRSVSQSGVRPQAPDFSEQVVVAQG